MAVTVYPPHTDDFSTNGLGVLMHIECEVEEIARGKYELTLTHPIDRTLRWMLLQPGAYIKAACPVRESPLYEKVAQGGETVVVREIYKVTGTSVGVNLRTGPGTGYKKLASYRNGTRVILLEKVDDTWFHVTIEKGGAVGYMSKKYLTLVESITETVAPEKPGTAISLEQSRDQIFEIASVEVDSKSANVTVTAVHAFYAETGNLVDSEWIVENKDVNDVLAAMPAKLARPAEINYHIQHLSGKVDGEYSYRSPVDILLNPDDGIVPQTGALLIRDNWDAYIIPDNVRDRGVTIRRGKNLIGVTTTTDASSVVTRIIPVGQTADGDPLYLSGTRYVDSPHINDYSYVRVQRIEYDVSVGTPDADNAHKVFKTAAAARAELKRLAEADFAENGVDLPTYGMEVDFVLLQNTDEYANYAGLQAVHMYDTVTVIDEMIGLKAKLRVTGYTWDPLKKQYNSVTLGQLKELEQTVYSFNIPDASVSGNKLVPNSVPGTALRNATIEYAKITNAAIELLAANAITALTARINEIVSDKITTDALYAAYAEMIALKIGSITAEDISTDSLAAALADITVLTAGTATFDKATVQHLVAQAMNLEYGTAGQVFIRNLAVEYAQMVGAAIGNLCIKASDGSYYHIDVNADGTVTATPTTVTDGEISAGQTESGRVILDTDITAANLNAGNLLATYALVNQIDAARIDVDQLFAREAFVNLLRTTKIVGDKSIEMIAETADSAKQEAEEAAIYEGVLPPPAPIPEGKLWLDRSIVPPVLKRWLGDADVPVDGTFTRTDVGNPVKTVGKVQRLDSIITAFEPVQAGSGDPSPENVRPLTGWNALNLNHARKNLFLMPEEKTLNGVTLSKQGDVWVLNGTATGSVNFASAPITLAGGEYTLCANNPVHLGYGQAIVQIYSATTGDSVYASNNKVNSSITQTITGASDYVCRIRVQSGFTYDNFVIQPQLELGSVATAYDAYQHELYIAKLGQTVYGGRYSWLTGMLTAEWYIEELQNADDWYYHVENDYMRHTLDHIVESMEFDDIVCSHYTCGTDHARIVIGGGVARVLRIYRTGFTDAESWIAFLDAQKAAGTPVQFAYKLAEPIEIQLAPQLITPFDGTNVFYGDGTISATYTGTGWETVNDVNTLRNAQDILIAQQDALRREVDELNSYTRLDNDGLWVGKQGATGQTLLKYDSVNIVVNGKPVAIFAGKYIEIGGMRMFVPNAGGLAFAPSGN